MHVATARHETWTTAGEGYELHLHIDVAADDVVSCSYEFMSDLLEQAGYEKTKK